MARHRIITLVLAAIVSLMAIVGAIATGGSGSTTAGSAPALPSTSSNGASDAPGTTTSTAGAVDPAAAIDETASAGDPDASVAVDPRVTAPPGAPAAPAAPIHDVLPGAGSPPPANPTDPSDPIGDLDDDRPVPGAFDFTAPPKKPGAPKFNGPGSLAVAPSCSHQCITKGVAYPRGFGVELQIDTTVPAQLFISAIADLDGDGEYEDLHAESVNFLVTSHTWAIDHLEPGQTYYVMAAATDEHQHTSHVWGEFTTLSQRTVFVEFGNGEIYGGPDNIDDTTWHFGLDAPLIDVTPGQQGILLYNDLPRLVDLDFWMARFWDAKVCEAWYPSASPQGHINDGCVAWNSTSIDDVDLDQAPAGKTRWTETSVTVSLHTPTGEGNALPPGYGDPYYFSFEVPVTLHVSYS